MGHAELKPLRIELAGRDGTVSFEAAPGERLLHAGLRAGLALPYECATGTCGSCRAKLVSGELEDLWPEAPGRQQAKAGEALLCQHAARGDCALQVRAPVAGSTGPAPGYLRGRIAAAAMLTHDVLRIQVALDGACEFAAGQFMLLEIPGVEGPRAYSMVNYARAAPLLDFVIRRKPGGGLSERLFGAGETAGLPLRLFGPLGKATYEPGLARDLLCIAGGTGIAGMMSILDCAAQSGHFAQHRAEVFFGVRTARDLFFLEELGALCERHPSMKATVALSDEAVPPALREAHPRLEFAQGFVHEAAAAQAGAAPGTRAYVAGPPPAVNAALGVLLARLRLPAAEIRYDKFG